MLRAKPKAVGSGPDIPDFMRVEPDEQAKMYDVYKVRPGSWGTAGPGVR